MCTCGRNDNLMIVITSDKMEKNKNKKREVHSILKILLIVDVHLSNAMVKLLEQFLPPKQLKSYYQFLEISCHGTVWIMSLLASIWIFNNTSLYQMQINLLIGLFIDIIVVAVLKALTRRRRPSINTDPLCIGPDKYSFPSGHASRAALVVYFFLNLWPVSSIITSLLFVWSFFICISRLLMRRHHILDICVGVLLGIIEGTLLGYLYLEQETCLYLISSISDT